MLYKTLLILSLPWSYIGVAFDGSEEALDGRRFRRPGFADENHRFLYAEHEFEQPLASLRVGRRNQNLVELFLGIVLVALKRRG